MIDEDWRDYVEDLKKMMHNGIVGDYFKSTEELEEEMKKLLSIVEVLENEVKIREKVRSELIWAKVISKIEAKVLDRETKVYERTGSTTFGRLIGYQASPASLVSFVQSSSSSTGQGPATPQENEELPAETELQEQVQQVQQAQLVLQAHPVSGEKP